MRVCVCVVSIDKRDGIGYKGLHIRYLPISPNDYHVVLFNYRRMAKVFRADSHLAQLLISCHERPIESKDERENVFLKGPMDIIANRDCFICQSSKTF